MSSIFLFHKSKLSSFFFYFKLCSLPYHFLDVHTPTREGAELGRLKSLERGRTQKATGAASAALLLLWLLLDPPLTLSCWPARFTPARPLGPERRVMQLQPHGAGTGPEIPFSPWQNLSRNQSHCERSK